MRKSLAGLSRLGREPLVGFLVLGAALLALDRFLAPAADDRQAIIVTATQQTALREAFRAEHRREPAAGELQQRLDRWIDEQVLYREALALGLDRRDVIVQRQLTQKMRFLIEDSSVLPEPSEAELQAWLDEHPERYGHPQTVSFEQVFLSRGRHGARLPAAAAALSSQLRAQPADFVGLGDPFLIGQVVAEADAARVRRDFGEGFAQSLQALPAGAWSGPILSSFGLHFVRVTARKDFQPATLADAGERVRVDYQLAQRDAQNRRALAELRARYRIRIEGEAG